MISLKYLGIPLSENAAYRRPKRAYGLILSARAKEFKADMLANTLEQLPTDFMLIDNSRVKVDIIVGTADKRRRDISNWLKLLLDVYNGVVYKDDSQIDDLRVRRIRGDKEFFNVDISIVE